MNVLTWHRMNMRTEDGTPFLTYYTDSQDWAGWSIDRLPQRNSSGTTSSIGRYEYQVTYLSVPIGPVLTRLRDAKALVEREGSTE